MLSRDYKDMIGGALLIAFGVFCASYAATHYPLGTLQEMGPGLFPSALGVVLVGIGLLIFVPALFRTGTMPQPEWWPMIAVLAGGAFFAFAVERLGIVPAVVGMTIIVRLADDKFSPLSSLVLAAILALVAVLVFRVGLNMPFAIVTWRFS